MLGKQAGKVIGVDTDGEVGGDTYMASWSLGLSLLDVNYNELYLLSQQMILSYVVRLQQALSI